jgi:hypothetical protein
MIGRAVPTARHESEQAPPEAVERALASLGALNLRGKLGEGGRSTVHDGVLDGRSVAVKVYKPSAVARHARKHPLDIAAFEHARNLAFYRADGLAPYVAEPVGFVAGPAVWALVQEKLAGRLYYFHFRETGARVDPGFMEHLRRIVERAHAADLFDVDLHSMNVFVVRGPGGEPWPKLFDFNLIPFNERPPNPLVGMLLRTGLMSARARDLRKLRNFHDFRRVERKLLRYYEPGS